MTNAIAGADAASQIRTLNDAFRSGDRPELGQVVMTAGVRELIGESPLAALALFKAVRTFDAFENGNDPYGERDFGSFDIETAKLFWKIDYYDKSLEAGSENPADPSITTRVLTIMLAEEY